MSDKHSALLIKRSMHPTSTVMGYAAHRFTIALLSAAVFLAFCIPFVSLAQSPSPSKGTIGPSSATEGTLGPSSSATGNSEGVLANPLKFKDLNELLTAILAAAIELGTIVLTLALIWTGFKFVAARGREEEIRSARTALMYTIIGGLILLGATAIKEVIEATITSIRP